MYPPCFLRKVTSFQTTSYYGGPQCNWLTSHPRKKMRYSDLLFMLLKQGQGQPSISLLWCHLSFTHLPFPGAVWVSWSVTIHSLTALKICHLILFAIFILSYEDIRHWHRSLITVFSLDFFSMSISVAHLERAFIQLSLESYSWETHRVIMWCYYLAR